MHLSQLFQVYICRCNFRFLGTVYSFCQIFAWVLSKMVQNIEARKALVPVTKQVCLSSREYTTPRLIAAMHQAITGKQGISFWTAFLVIFGTIWILDPLNVLRLIYCLVFWVWKEYVREILSLWLLFCSKIDQIVDVCRFITFQVEQRRGLLLKAIHNELLLSWHGIVWGILQRLRQMILGLLFFSLTRFFLRVKVKVIIEKIGPLD